MLRNNRKTDCRKWVFLFLMGAAVCLQAQAPPEFKADLLMSGGRGGDTIRGKMYFGAAKIRMEMSVGGEKQIMIVDTAKKVQYFIMPEDEMYMEMRNDASMPGAPKTPKVEVMDPANPCSGDPKANCKKLGTETVNGRATEKWQVEMSREKATMWIDQKLHIPIKTVSSDGLTTEFSNLAEGKQDANLFVIPAGYEKMDMGDMMKMPGGMR